MTASEIPQIDMTEPEILRIDMTEPEIPPSDMLWTDEQLQTEIECGRCVLIEVPVPREEHHRETQPGVFIDTLLGDKYDELREHDEHERDPFASMPG